MRSQPSTPAICETCGSPFLTWPYKLRTGTRRFCSLACRRPYGDLRQRLEAQTDRSGDCWIWTGAKGSDGYGKLSVGPKGAAKTWRTHRAAWHVTYGTIPDGLDILHHCDNPPCVRPDHLFLGTQRDNGADMASKGRSTKGRRMPQLSHPGEQSPLSRLTESEVREIRQTYANGAESGYSLARRFGVAYPTVKDILHRRTWKHLP